MLREAATPAAVPTPVVVAVADELTIVGRCVDEAGMPLTGVQVEGSVYGRGGGRTHYSGYAGGGGRRQRF